MHDIEQIKELRDLTGLSFKEIKRALEQSGGDKTITLQALKELGATVAEKKSTRSTGQGIIEAYVHTTKRVGAIVVLLCETDFVAKNLLFLELAHEIAMHVAAMEPKTDKELLAQAYIKDQNISVQDLIGQYVAKLGENIKVRAFSRYQI